MAVSVTLNWTYPASGPTPQGFNVYRTTGSALGTPLASVPASQLTYVDTAPVYGTYYTYAVKAYNEAGEGTLKQVQVSVTVPAPAAPDTLTAVVNP
jgi:hypothetical protein